jgi:hypothetical protein
MQSEIDRLSRQCIALRNQRDNQQAEIERLRAELKDRTEAARFIWDEFVEEYAKDADGGAIFERFPWLEVSDETS